MVSRLGALGALGATLALSIAWPTSPARAQSLEEARRGVPANTSLVVRQGRKAAKPPKGVLDLIAYPAPGGATSGYITPPAADGIRRPAIIWISGGDLAIGDFWTPQPAASDQTAGAFREAGIVVFYPSLRGLNGNPGQSEGFYGEVDDLIAAAAWLKTRADVDPERIYLGGHSSGGTLVMLASEMADVWRGVFSFGPVSNPRLYNSKALLPLDPDNTRGEKLRSPGAWLASVRKPLYVVEGASRGNASEVTAMRDANTNANIRFRIVSGCTHFSVLLPVSTLIAKAIVADDMAPLDDETTFNGLCAGE